MELDTVTIRLPALLRDCPDYWKKFADQFDDWPDMRKELEGMKQQGETNRELMRQTAKAHNTETMAEVKVNDQNTRAITSQNKMEIEAIMELLIHHMDTSRLEREIEKRNAEQYAYMNAAASDISHQGNPLTQQGM